MYDPICCKYIMSSIKNSLWYNMLHLYMPEGVLYNLELPDELSFIE